MSATIELQVRLDTEFSVNKTNCSLTIEVDGNKMVLCDAVNGTAHVAKSLHDALSPFVSVEKPEPDPYAERYEALGLPDGWAWEVPNTVWGVQWGQFRESAVGCNDSLRRILNRKAYKPGQEPKEKP